MFRSFIKRLGWWGVFVLGLLCFFIAYVLDITVPSWLFWLMGVTVATWVGYLLVRDYIKYYKNKAEGKKRQAIAVGIIIVALTLTAWTVLKFSGLSEKLFPQYDEGGIIESPVDIDSLIEDSLIDVNH